MIHVAPGLDMDALRGALDMNIQIQIEGFRVTLKFPNSAPRIAKRG